MNISPATDREGFVEDPHDAFGDGMGGLRYVLDQHGELVTAEPGHGVAGADAVPDPVGDVAQKTVAGGVPEAVVDQFEVVEVEQQHRDRRSRAEAQLHRVVQPVGEQRPVGEPGEWIVQGDVGDRDVQFAVLLEQGELAKRHGEDEDQTGDENGAHRRHRPQVDGAEDDGERQWHVGQPRSRPGTASVLAPRRPKPPAGRPDPQRRSGTWRIPRPASTASSSKVPKVSR